MPVRRKFSFEAGGFHLPLYHLTCARNGRRCASDRQEASFRVPRDPCTARPVARRNHISGLPTTQPSGNQARQGYRGRIEVARRSDRSLEVIDPHAGIDQNHLSLLIALRSPCQSSLPRSRRISACFLSRSKVRRSSSTASRLVFRPVARSVSRISLSSIMMFVRIEVYLNN